MGNKQMKKAKKSKRKPRKPTSYMMVIRVAVPARHVPTMKIERVWGRTPRAFFAHDLEILSAYYDMPGQPNARR
jgi:hypothetical protein